MNSTLPASAAGLRSMVAGKTTRVGFRAVSGWLGAFSGLAQLIQPDALTAWPVWVWVVIGCALWLAGFSRQLWKHAVVVVLLWLPSAALLLPDLRALAPWRRWPAVKGDSLRIVSLNCAGGETNPYSKRQDRTRTSSCCRNPPTPRHLQSVSSRLGLAAAIGADTSILFAGEAREIPTGVSMLRQTSGWTRVVGRGGQPGGVMGTIAPC